MSDNVIQPEWTPEVLSRPSTPEANKEGFLNIGEGPEASIKHVRSGSFSEETQRLDDTMVTIFVKGVIPPPKAQEEVSTAPLKTRIVAIESLPVDNKIEMEIFHHEIMEAVKKYIQDKKLLDSAQKTIEGIFTIFEHRDELAKIEPELERNSHITKLTGLYAEPKFFVGATTEDERKDELERIYQLLKVTYSNAKSEDKLQDYFLRAFDSSGSCFNARINQLKLYVSGREDFGQLNYKTPIEELAPMTEFYFKYRDSLSKKLPTQEGFLRYLKESLEKEKEKGQSLPEEFQIAEKYCKDEPLFQALYPSVEKAYDIL